MLQIWESLCKEFTPEQLSKVLRRTVPGFRPIYNSLDSLIIDDVFDKAAQIGVIELPDTQTVFVGAVHVKGELTARSGKRKQYDLAKRILRHGDFNAGIFAFYDNAGRFRFSLVTITYHGTKRQYSTFRRYTFFVDPELPNKTFLQQMQRADFSSISGILGTFSLEAVTDEFYKKFKNKFDALPQLYKVPTTRVKTRFALVICHLTDPGFKKGYLIIENHTKLWEEYPNR